MTKVDEEHTSRPHRRPRQLSAFLPPPLAERVDAVRRAWDPTMAALVAPHITVCHELPDEPTWRPLAEPVSAVGRLRVVVGGVSTWGGAGGGIYLTVDDTDGTLARVRAIVGETPPPGLVYEPHVTLVHPATVSPDLAARAWTELAGWTVDETLEVDYFDVIAFDGSRWASIERVPLHS